MRIADTVIVSTLSLVVGLGIGLAAPDQLRGGLASRPAAAAPAATPSRGSGSKPCAEATAMLREVITRSASNPSADAGEFAREAAKAEAARVCTTPPPVPAKGG